MFQFSITIDENGITERDMRFVRSALGRRKERFVRMFCSSGKKEQESMPLMTFLVGGFVCIGILSAKRVAERKTGNDYSFISMLNGNFGKTKRRFTERVAAENNDLK